jgi:putative transposase
LFFSITQYPYFWVSGKQGAVHTVRGEWLGQYIFETIEEAQHQATEWLWTNNNQRPNVGIGGITPAMKLKMAA